MEAEDDISNIFANLIDDETPETSPRKETNPSPGKMNDIQDFFGGLISDDEETEEPSQETVKQPVPAVDPIVYKEAPPNLKLNLTGLTSEDIINKQKLIAEKMLKIEQLEQSMQHIKEVVYEATPDLLDQMEADQQEELDMLGDDGELAVDIQVDTARSAFQDQLITTYRTEQSQNQQTEEDELEPEEEQEIDQQSSEKEEQMIAPPVQYQEELQFVEQNDQQLTDQIQEKEDEQPLLTSRPQIQNLIEENVEQNEVVQQNKEPAVNPEVQENESTEVLSNKSVEQNEIEQKTHRNQIVSEVKHEIQEIMSDDSEDYLVTEDEIQSSLNFTNINLINDHVYRNYTVPPEVTKSEEKKVEGPIQEDNIAEEVKPTSMGFSIFNWNYVGGKQKKEPAVQEQKEVKKPQTQFNMYQQFMKEFQDDED